MKLLDDVTADAVLSPCGTYRYTLSRHWYAGAETRHVLFIMLNPSIADAHTDDRTVRKCQKYARAWGFAGITVVNLFALRSKDPRELVRHPDPVGPVNDEIIEIFACTAGVGRIVAAWGKDGALFNRGLIVAALLEQLDVPVYRLGAVTKGGHPWHPLYRPDDCELQLHIGTEVAA